jgi:hypothetical protein
MEFRTATHAEAVVLAKSLNVQTELVWQIIQGLRFSSTAELERAVHDAFLPHGKHGLTQHHHDAQEVGTR